MIDYEHICKVAKYRARKLPPSFDWRDLAQEAAACCLAGRQSVDGPMQDYVRKQGMKGNRRGQSYFEYVPLENAPAAKCNDQVIMPRLQHVIDSLPFRWRTILRLLYWQGLNMEEVAKQMAVNPSRISQLHTAALNEIRESIQ